MKVYWEGKRTIIPVNYDFSEINKYLDSPFKALLHIKKYH